MPGGKNMAGSCACCACTPSATHICICNCLTPVPRQLFFGDANGTHTLNWNGPSLNWSGVFTQAGVDVYVQSPFCTFTTTTLNYTVTLAYSCPTGTGLPTSVAFPTGNWSLNVVFGGLDCSGPKYTNGLFASAVILRARQIVTGMTCDISGGLSFTIPTAVSDPGIAGSLATPGGGGLLTVVP